MTVLSPLLALALAAAPPASPLDPPPPARLRVPGVGRVLQVTAARAYLDAGADDGLAPGDVLVLRRGDVASGRCTVDAVAPGSATCTGAGARPGDTFGLTPPTAPAVKVVTLPALVAEAELERRSAAVAAVPVALVEFKGSPKGAPPMAAARTTFAEVELGGAAWTTSGSDTWDVARLDASLHGPALGPITLDLDLRAERWRPRGPGGSGEVTRLHVWQAQLGWARRDGALSLAAGRILPWTVPGASVMDGALAGVRGEAWEAGLFGGLVPVPDTLGAGSERATAGGYWAIERRLGRTVALRHEGRLAWVRSPELGERGELEAVASVHAGALLDLYATARLGAGGSSDHATGWVDSARLELLLRPVRGLSVDGGLAYGGLAAPWAVVPPAFGARAVRADVTAFQSLGPLRLGLTAGGSRDEESGLDRSWLGPEVQLPRVFTPRLSLSAGYLEERGWLEGRSAFLQAVARPWSPVRFIARVWWSHEASLAMDREEVALSLTSTAELTRRIGLRLSVLGRAAFDTASGGEQTPPHGVNASASVYALF